MTTRMAGVLSILSIVACAHRTSNQVDAKQETIVSKPVAGNRYDRKALYLHQIPTDSPAAAGTGPYFCAYLISTNQVRLEGSTDLVRNALQEREKGNIILAETDPKTDSKYSIYPINITAILKRHYGFNEPMLRQGMEAALAKAKSTKLSDTVKMVGSTAKAIFADIPSAIFTVVTQRQNSFDAAQSADEVGQSFAEVTELKKTCAINENMETAYNAVRGEMRSSAAGRISREVKADIAIFDAIETGIRAIKETPETKKQALCPERYSELLEAFNRFDAACK